MAGLVQLRVMVVLGSVMIAAAVGGGCGGRIRGRGCSPVGGGYV